MGGNLSADSGRAIMDSVCGVLLAYTDLQAGLELAAALRLG